MSKISSFFVSYSRISQAIKEPIKTQTISRLFNGKKMSQIIDIANVTSPDHPKPSSQSIFSTRPIKGYQTQQLMKEPLHPAP